MGASRIKWLVMDVDGTLTDGKIYMGPDGEIMKAFDVKDGYAIANILPKMSIEPVIITGRKSDIVAQRCEELGVVKLYQGVQGKLDLLQELTSDAGIRFSQIGFIGDDLNDFECMSVVKRAGGVTACPADAVEAIKSICAFVSTQFGGHGAVREIIEWMVSS